MDKYVYGPVPSRRMGSSLGISPLPGKTCNYSCIYCQLGRTNHFTNQREMFVSPGVIIRQFKEYLAQSAPFDVVTIVGEGEPTLFQGLGELLAGIRPLTHKPLAVITNGALLKEKAVQEDLQLADIVLPSLDAFDEASFRRINRPHPGLNFAEVYQGLDEFSQSFSGQLWLEIMLLKGLNDSPEAIATFARLLARIKYQRLYLNTPVRPPAERRAQAPEAAGVTAAVRQLGGICIDQLAQGDFSGDNPDDYQAILEIIGRHPMNQHEVNSLLVLRGSGHELTRLLGRLRQDQQVESLDYMGYTTFRLRR